MNSTVKGIGGSLLVGTLVAASIAVFNPKPRPPSGPLGSITNPVDLDNNPIASTLNTGLTVRNIYRDGTDTQSIEIPKERVFILSNLLGGEFVKVQSGDASRTFNLQVVCANKEPALRITEDGDLVGSAKIEGSALTTPDIYNGKSVVRGDPNNSDIGRLLDNPCVR